MSDTEGDFSDMDVYVLEAHLSSSIGSGRQNLMSVLCSIQYIHTCLTIVTFFYISFFQTVIPKVLELKCDVTG